MRNRLMESLDRRVGKNLEVRRYSLPAMISESYNMMYNSGEGTNLKKLIESHIEDVRSNPSDVDRLSRQLSLLKELSRMVESREISDRDLVEKKPVAKKRPVPVKRVKESKEEDLVDECDKNDLNEETELTDEEVEELTKHLEEIRKKNGSKPTEKKEDIEESVEDFDANKGKSKLVDEENQDTVESKENRQIVKPEYCNESLKSFADKSKGKAFMKTFKKLDSKLHEGTALTRQESINLYKAANSAMTHLSVELEHNPEFLKTFKESVGILSSDVSKLLESLSNGKAPSKKTMKSLAKFSEAILREAEEDEEEEETEEIPEEEVDTEEEDIEATPEEEDEDFIGDDEGDIESEASEEFDQEYADARVELHKQLVSDHEEEEDPAIQEKIAQDAAEVLDLPGITDEQIAEITGEEPEATEEDPDSEIPAEEEDLEEPAEEETPADDSDITDEELEELKKHLREMRAAKRK